LGEIIQIKENNPPHFSTINCKKDFQPGFTEREVVPRLAA
jgi:hypothetical protein